MCNIIIFIIWICFVFCCFAGRSFQFQCVLWITFTSLFDEQFFRLVYLCLCSMGTSILEHSLASLHTVRPSNKQFAKHHEVPSVSLHFYFLFVCEKFYWLENRRNSRNEVEILKMNRTNSIFVGNFDGFTFCPSYLPKWKCMQLANIVQIFW